MKTAEMGSVGMSSEHYVAHPGPEQNTGTIASPMPSSSLCAQPPKGLTCRHSTGAPVGLGIVNDRSCYRDPMAPHSLISGRYPRTRRYVRAVIGQIQGSQTVWISFRFTSAGAGNGELGADGHHPQKDMIKSGSAAQVATA